MSGGSPSDIAKDTLHTAEYSSQEMEQERAIERVQEVVAKEVERLASLSATP